MNGEETKILQALVDADTSLTFSELKAAFGYGNDATSHALFLLQKNHYIDIDTFDTVDHDAWVITDSGRAYLSGINAK